MNACGILRRPNLAWKSLLTAVFVLSLCRGSLADSPCQWSLEKHQKAVELYLKSRDPLLSSTARANLRDRASTLDQDGENYPGARLPTYPEDCDKDTQFYASFSTALTVLYYLKGSDLDAVTELLPFHTLEEFVGQAGLSVELFQDLLGEQVDKLKHEHIAPPKRDGLMGNVIIDMLARWNISF